jgi:dienelactone hydrolase
MSLIQQYHQERASLIAPRSLWIGLVIAISVSFANAQNSPLIKPSIVADVRTTGNTNSTVLVSHGSGCLEQQSHNWAKQLNEWGYNAVVIDHCTTRGIRRYTQSGVGPPVELQPRDKALDYILIAKWLEEQAWHKGKVGVIGFSMGGTGVLKLIDDNFSSNTLASTNKAYIDAAVAFYPECKRDRPPQNPTIPTLIHHGESDELALSRRCKYAELQHPNYQIMLYANVHHSFDDKTGDGRGTNIKGESKILRRYDREADNKSRASTKEFLGRFLDNLAK